MSERLSKEEILFEAYEKFPYDLDMKTTTEAAALHAMDEWAKQYGEYLLKVAFPNMLPANDLPKTNDQLYNLYRKSINK